MNRFDFNGFDADAENYRMVIQKDYFLKGGR